MRNLKSILVKDLFGFKIPVEIIIGTIGIVILLEATRRAIGLPLVMIAICFLLFSYIISRTHCPICRVHH